MSTDTIPIRRHFVEVAGRQVHYRRIGTGPPLVMLHASPVSSQSLEQRMRPLAGRWTVIALDTPGYGRSAPLPQPQPEITDYAGALEQTLQALGLQRVMLYGRHTGACIAVALAGRAPDRVAAIWCDGYPVLDDQARARYLGDYLQTVAPTWDGSHLTWHWYRYREQFIHWPWQVQGPETRADADLPTLEELHRGTLDMLTAEPCYTTAYAAAFRFDSLGALAQVSCPVLFAARPGDSLYRAVQALPPLPPYMQVVAVPRDPAAASAVECEALERFATGLLPAPAPPITAGGAGYLHGPYGELAVELGGAAEGRPWLLLPPAPGATALLDIGLDRWRPASPWLSVDLPGHGHSAAIDPEQHALATYAEAIEWVCRELDLREPLLYGSGTGGAVALELALRKRVRPPVLALDDLPVLTAEARRLWRARLAVELAPSAEGAHLLRAWHQVRDLALWRPASAGRQEAIRLAGPSITPAALQRRVLPLLLRPEAHAPGWGALLGEDLAWRVDVLAIPLVLVSRPEATLGRVDPGLADRPAAGGRLVQPQVGVSPLAAASAACEAMLPPAAQHR
ncbi:MAG: alpha/beta fold hydrolase [Gammaproteobacteria bacterium]|nr:alpha/beta fold hydrolase [Gammaproteobacteria bacterium]